MAVISNTIKAPHIFFSNGKLFLTYFTKAQDSNFHVSLLVFVLISTAGNRSQFSREYMRGKFSTMKLPFELNMKVGEY